MTRANLPMSANISVRPFENRIASMSIVNLGRTSERCWRRLNANNRTDLEASCQCSRQRGINDMLGT
jgi:hypothetical protein